MKDSLNTLKELASSVRNATKEGENSAERIGRLFEGILEYIKTPESIENYFELKQDSNGLDYIYTKYNIASAGALSMYASDKINVPSIYDGLPIDNDTIYWHEVDGSKVLKAKGGGGEAGSVQWDNISGKPSWIEDTKPSYSWSDITGEKPFYTKEEIASKYVTIDTEQEITALKHFTAGLSVGESKKKIYEENGVVYIDADVAVTGAMTFYATAGRTVSTIMDAVTVDGITIKKENNVLKAVSGAGSSFDENAMWSALSGSSDNQINKSHLTNALAGYATQNWVIENYATKSELSAVSNKLNDFLEGSDTDEIINKWKELEAFLSGMAETDNLAEILETKADKKYVDSTFVTLATKQTITGEKTFSSVLNTAAIKASGAITAPSLAVSDWVTIAGIKLRKLEDGALMLEGNLALTGALTMYASNGQSFDTIYDGLPIDNDTIYWQEVDGSRVLKAREGSGSSFDKSAMWTALAGSTTEQINKSHLTTALTGYATESWVSRKNYAVKATTLAGYGITDGVNDVSVTGTGNAVTAASISGHTLTLTKGSTFSLSGHKHAWSDITSGKPSTLSGYGITDAYTKTEADSRYINASGDTMTGALRFANNIWNQFGDDVAIGDCNGSGLLGIKPINSAIPGFRFYNNSGSVLGELKCNNGTLVYGSGGYTIWHSGNDGPGSGSNADLLDGYNETDFFRINRGYVDSTESSLLYRLNGTIVDTSTAGWSGMYAGFCASGSMSALVFRLLGGGQGMNKIYINYSVDGSRWGDAWRIIATTDSNVNSATQLLNKRNIWGQPFNGTADITGDMSNINDINMSGTLRIYGTNPLFYPSFGGGWYMLDETWMRVYGNKNIYTEGMVEANGGFMAFASYSDTNSASHKLDIFNCAFKNTVEAYVNHNSSRSMLGWMDTVSGYGYRTRYVIGSERGYNSAWGKMYLAVSNNDNGTSIGCNLELRGDGWVVASGSIRANLNILADGGCSFYGSDIRYKSIMQQVNLSLLDIAKAPSFVYRWNRPNMNQNRLNLGGSAQYTQTILPWAVEENDNFLSMDYATVAYTFAVHTARHLLTYETRTDKKIKKLENRVKYLEKQLKKLGYEEVRTLDDQSV